MAPAHADWVRRGLFQRKRVVIDLIVLELPEMPYSAIFACLPARLHLPYWGIAYRLQGGGRQAVNAMGGGAAAKADE